MKIDKIPAQAIPAGDSVPYQTQRRSRDWWPTESQVAEHYNTWRFHGNPNGKQQQGNGERKNGIPHKKQRKCHAKRKRKSIIGILIISDKSKIKTGIFLESFFF
jgi:hypothetical protein